MLLKNMDTVLDIKAQGRLVKALSTRKDTATPQQKMAAFNELLSLGLTRVLTGAYAVALLTSLVGVHVSVQSKLMVQDGSEQATTAVPGGAAPLAITDTVAGESGAITEMVKAGEVLMDPASTLAEVGEVASKVRRCPALPVPSQPSLTSGPYPQPCRFRARTCATHLRNAVFLYFDVLFRARLFPHMVMLCVIAKSHHV
jgi:hypothetical protein